MISRLYTWRVSVPSDRDPPDALARAEAAGVRVQKFNPNVLSVRVTLDGNDLLIRIHFEGRDQWWIKKQIPYAIGGVLAQAKLSFAGAKLTLLERPEDERSTRRRASDGRHNPIPDDQDIDHCDMMDCEPICDEPDCLRPGCTDKHGPYTEGELDSHGKD